MSELLLEEKKTEQPTPPAPKPRRYILQKGICIFCAALAATVLCLYGWHTLDKMLRAGFWESVGNCLLSHSATNNRSTFAFADLPTGIEVSDLTPKPALPRIYYIPKEDLVDRSFDKKSELEQKIFDLYAFDYAKVPTGTYPILPTDLSVENAQALKNDTSYNVDMTEFAKSATLREAETILKEPLVLIVHTHGTEGFAAEGAICYSEKVNQPRTEDVSQNIVAVGKTLSDALNKKGIPTIHCEIMHDIDSYIAAYDRSAESIAHYLEKYPSIRYVFDVHRDSLIRSDLTKLRPVTLHKGAPCAQIMMIVGSDEKGAGEYDWQSNLVLAEAIQQNLVKDTLGVARQLYLRGATYNQQYAQYGLLLEIGSCGNSLSEAKAAALAFADAFEKVLKNK